MYIARLRISLLNQHIRRNTPEELGATVHRGDLLKDGAVLRGAGTSFVNEAAKERYGRLMTEQNLLREKFNQRFMRAPFDGYFVINKPGEAKEFAASMEHDPENTLSVTEFSISSLGVEGFDEEAMASWGERVKNQLKRVPLGRRKEDGKPKVDPEGLDALMSIANCPALGEETREKIKALVAAARANTIDRFELHREIELVNVTMDSNAVKPLELEREV